MNRLARQWIGGGLLLAVLSATAGLWMGCTDGAQSATQEGPRTAKNLRSTAIMHEPCDPAGKKVENLDANGDGKPDLTRVFDGSGREQCRFSDLNRDGKPDLWQYYDGAGQIRRREADYDDNGIPNLIEIFEGGRLVRRELDTTSQGRIDTWDTYDTQTGKIVRRERDATADGRIDQWWVYEGDKVTISMDRNGDGNPDPEFTVTIGDAPPDAGVAPPPPPPTAAPVAPAAPTEPTPTPDAGAPKPKRGDKK